MRKKLTSRSSRNPLKKKKKLKKRVRSRVTEMRRWEMAMRRAKVCCRMMMGQKGASQTDKLIY
jgi:hypothetical protein